MFSLICVWINGWINNREAGDLRRHRCHYDVNVMICAMLLSHGMPVTLLTLCMGIHQSLVDSARKVPVTEIFDISFISDITELLKKQPICRWHDTSRCPCDDLIYPVYVVFQLCPSWYPALLGCPGTRTYLWFTSSLACQRSRRKIQRQFLTKHLYCSRKVSLRSGWSNLIWRKTKATTKALLF